MKSCLIAVLGLLVLAGCGAPGTTRPGTAAPAWVSAPEHAGYLSVVGSAPRQAGGSEAQYRVALTKARQALSETVRVRVEHDHQQAQLDGTGASLTVVDSTTRLSSQNALSLARAEVTAQWTDPDNGELYLLVELPLDGSVRR